MSKRISKEIIKLAKKYSKTNNKKACKISWKMFYTGLGRHQYWRNSINFKINIGYKRLKPKLKKRNGKNQIKSNSYLYQCNCGHQFTSNKKWNNREIYCPETDCETCIEKRK